MRRLISNFQTDGTHKHSISALQIGINRGVGKWGEEQTGRTPHLSLSRVEPMPSLMLYFKLQA